MQLNLFAPVLTCSFGSIWWVECGSTPCAKCTAYVDELCAQSDDDDRRAE